MRSKIGHYEIVTELGRGGMGVVYKGYEPSLNRHVAIKTLADHLASNPSVVERFMREARSMAQLSDAHIVPIYFVGEDRGLPFFAMEFVEGESVADRLKREGRLPALEARRIVLQAAQGLAVAHEHGVVHRDIKPANLLLNTRGVVKVADFGISLAASDMQQKLTGTGQLVGTPGYLSPEVCLGKPTDARSDIFSLGIVLFEMLTGRMPFLDESPLGLMLSVVQSNLPDVRELASDVDEYSVQILEAMVAKDPEARYQDCGALIDALLAAGTPYHPGQTGHTPIPGRQTAETRMATPLPAVPPRATNPPPAATPGPTSILPTPPPMARPASAAAASAAAAPPARRRSAVLPIAVAMALLVTMAAAAGIVYTRSAGDEPAPLLAAADPASPAAVVDPTTTLAAADTSGSIGTDPGPGSDAGAGAGIEPIVDSAALPADLPEPVTSDAKLIAESAPSVGEAGPTASDQPAAAPAAEAAPDGAAAAASWSAEASPSASGTSDSGTASAPPRPRQRLNEARQEWVAMRSDAASERRTPAAPARLPQRTVVLAVGDPAITGPARAAIEEALEDAGVQLADADLIPGLHRYAEDDLVGLLGAVARAGVARTIVTLRVVPIGEQQLTYYGEVSTLYSAHLNLRAFDVADRQPIGRMRQAKVSFTSLNAEENTRVALAPVLDSLTDALRGR